MNDFNDKKKLSTDNNKDGKINKKTNYFLKSDRLGLLDHEEVNDITNRVVSWYKIKIPDEIFSTENNKLTLDTNNYSYKNYKKMTFDELLKRNSYLSLLKCNFGTDNTFSTNDLVIKIFTFKGFLRNKVDKVCNIYASKDDGRVLRIDGDNLLSGLIDKELSNYNLEDICLLLNKKHIDNFNYDNLKSCITNRNKNILTRNKIIYRVCSDLIFSCEKIEYGIFRASEFLKDIDLFLNLNLGTDYLEKIIVNDNLEKKDTNKRKKFR